MAVIFGTSCTWVPSKTFVRAVATSTSEHVSQQGFDAFWSEWWWVFVKGYHVLEYLILSVLIWPLASTRKLGRWVTVVFAFLYACSDEYHQTFVPGRGGKFSDVMIDSIGIAIAMLVVAFWTRRDKRKGGRASVRPAA